jgi:hypothetical protein
MTTNKLLLLCLVAAVAAGSQAAVAQVAEPKPAKRLKTMSPDANVAVSLRDGSVVYGRLERQDADSVVVVAAMGRMAFAVSTITQLKPAGTARKRSDGTTDYWFPNPNGTRLLFGPTGRTLGAGEGYFADHYVVFASVGLGVTDRVQMGAGTLLFPTEEFFWFLMPKFGVIQSETFNVSVGALYGGAREETAGIAYAVGTYGSTDRSVTVGIGQGIIGSETEGKPIFMIGGESRISRRMALVSENYFGSGAREGVVSYGIRFLGDRFTVDLAFLNTTVDPVFPGFPYLDFVIRW